MKTYRIVYTILMIVTTPFILILSTLTRMLSAFMRWMAVPIVQDQLKKLGLEQLQNITVINTYEIVHTKENNINTYVIDVHEKLTDKEIDVLLESLRSNIKRNS